MTLPKLQYTVNAHYDVLMHSITHRCNVDFYLKVMWILFTILV